MGTTITITLTEYQDDLLRTVAEEEGSTLSQTARSCLENGLFARVDHLNKIEVYKGLVAKRKKSQQVQASVDVSE